MVEICEIPDGPSIPGQADGSYNTDEPPLPANHRRIREDLEWLIQGPIQEVDVLSSERLQDQFKKCSSVLSLIRHLDGDTETTEVSLLKPLDIPDDVRSCREFTIEIADVSLWHALLKKYLQYDLVDDPGKMNVLSEDPKDLRTQNVRLVLRIIGCIAEITCTTAQEALELCVSAVGSSCVNETALITIARMADHRRRLGTKVRPLCTSQSLMKLMESMLHILSMKPHLTQTLRHALVLIWLLLIGDRERSDADEVDINAVISSLIHPYLLGPTQNEWYLGVMALNYLYLADRRAVKDHIFMGDLAATLLGLAAAPTTEEPRLQNAALSLIVGLVEFHEIRMLFLQNGIIDIFSTICMLSHTDVRLKARVAAGLARISLHDEDTRTAVFKNFEFFDITKEVLQILNPEDLEAEECNELTQLVLETVFFLSIHSVFKAQLVTALAPVGEEQMIKTEDKTAMLKAPMLVESLPKFGAAAVASGNPLCMYTYCGIIGNLTRSSEDKEKLKRVPGMPNWDDEQMEQVQVMMDRLPDNAKPVSNGKFDRGDDSLVAELVDKLIDSGAINHVCKILVKTNISTNLAALGATSIRQCISKQRFVKNRGLLVKVGGFSALLNACSILQKDQSWNVTATDELRLIRQSLAQLAIGVSPKTMSYREQLSLVPHMMCLLEDRHQLFNYEGLLVLTNISSQSEEVRDRIFYHADGWQKIVSCAFEDHDSLRAAGVELMANMSLCDKLLDRFAAGHWLQDLRFLMACCQEVTNDRCLHAAAGALAMMTRDLRVATVILEDLENLDTVFEVLQICVAKGDTALLVRIAVFIRNLVQAGVDQIARDGSKREKDGSELSKKWSTVAPIAEFVLNVLSKDLNALVQNPEVTSTFKGMQVAFNTAVQSQRSLKGTRI